jgi:hypothetical protein
MSIYLSIFCGTTVLGPDNVATNEYNHLHRKIDKNHSSIVKEKPNSYLQLLSKVEDFAGIWNGKQVQAFAD